MDNAIEFEKVESIFNIREERLEWFKDRMAKLAKRAAKLGVEAPGYGVGVAYDVEEKDPETGLVERVLRYYPVTVTGKAPKIAGWTFAATVQHLPASDGNEAANIIRNITGHAAPLQYRTAAPDCQHCNLKRRRNDTFLVLHEEGEWKQIGRNCIKDFLGHADPEKLAAQAEFIAEALGYGGDEGDGFGWNVDRAGILVFLATTAAAIKEHGWLSRTKARELEKTATADRVLHLIFPGNDREARARAQEWRRKHVNEAAVERAKLALDWVLGLDDTVTAANEYLYNIRAAARVGTVESRMAGYVASIASAYSRAMDEIAERRARPESNFQGEVGERIVRTLTVVKTRQLESDFGVKTLYMFCDAAGNDYKWFSSGDLSFEEGETATLIGTVKKHDEYKGRKQTMLNRCALHYEKVKKNKETKAIAAGIVAFMNFAVGDLIRINGVEEAFYWLKNEIECQHRCIGYALESFFIWARDYEKGKEIQIVNGLQRFLENLHRRAKEEAAVVGDCLASFFQARYLYRAFNGYLWSRETQQLDERVRVLMDEMKILGSIEKYLKDRIATLQALARRCPKDADALWDRCHDLNLILFMIAIQKKNLTPRSG